MLQHIRQHAWLQLLIASAACALLLGGSFVAAQDGGANTDDAEAAEQDAENATAGQQGVVRVARLIYGAPDPKSGGAAHGARVFAHPQAHHAPVVVDG